MGELATWAKLWLGRGETVMRGARGLRPPAIAARGASPKAHDAAVAARVAAVTPGMSRAKEPFRGTPEAQRRRFDLPAFPTTTIGSFPQTAEVRKARSAHAKGALTTPTIETFLREETARAVRWQEEIGLDVLVHGEFERNDMVQYFGEQLSGFAFTKHGWVQSYGSRCVASADHLRRRFAPGADDGDWSAILPIADRSGR